MASGRASLTPSPQAAPSPLPNQITRPYPLYISDHSTDNLGTNTIRVFYRLRSHSCVFQGEKLMICIHLWMVIDLQCKLLNPMLSCNMITLSSLTRICYVCRVMVYVYLEIKPSMTFSSKKYTFRTGANLWYLSIIWDNYIFIIILACFHEHSFLCPKTTFTPYTIIWTCFIFWNISIHSYQYILLMDGRGNTRPHDIVIFIINTLYRQAGSKKCCELIEVVRRSLRIWCLLQQLFLVTLKSYCNNLTLQ